MQPTSLTTSSLRLGLAAALVAGASAQIGFNPPTSVATGARAESPVLADLDGDGDLDLAVATEGAGNLDIVELFANDGAGNFSPAGTIFLANGSSPHSLAASDLDGDGDTDLAVTLKNINQVQALINGGGFTFTPGASVGTGGVEPRQITAADMDGDGDADLVISNRDSSSVSVVRNTAGVLSLVGAFAAGDEARDNAVGDFDGDGDMDVAVASHDSRQVAFLTNVGGGALSAPTFLSTPVGTRPSGLAAADMDGDGDIDVVAGAGDDNNPAQNFVSIYRNNGGVFTGPFNFTTGGLDAGDVFVGDLDGDGDMDVVAANETSGSLAILAGAGGNLGAPTLIQFSTPDTIIGGDVDGNGSLDLAVTRRQLAGVSIFENQASGGPGGGFMNYCLAAPNSTGGAAQISGTGSTSVAANNLSLVATGLPQNSAGLFLVSATQGFTANPGGSQGNLCLGGTIGRFQQQVQNSGAAGVIAIPVNLQALPMPNGTATATAGDTWNFQAWYRDAVGGQATSNFTNGLAATFTQ